MRTDTDTASASDTELYCIYYLSLQTDNGADTATDSDTDSVLHLDCSDTETDI